MNILISTTTNHNCGDDWIRIGVKNILKHIFTETPNYIHYDRNPNNMVDYPHDQRMKEGLMGNFMNNPIDWDKIDLVVLAGSPEWLHHPLEPIYEGLSEHSNIPLWAIGVGYTEPEFVLPLTTHEMKVLKRPSTIIITRQQELSDRLEPMLKKVIYTLPCPALFCFEDYPEKTENNCNHAASHSISELNDKSFFSSDAYDILNFIGKHKRYVSDRLHGAIAAISSGANTGIITNGDFRIEEGIKPFGEVLSSDISSITPFKVRTLNNYVNIINNHNEPFKRRCTI